MEEQVTSLLAIFLPNLGPFTAGVIVGVVSCLYQSSRRERTSPSITGARDVMRGIKVES